MSSFRQLKDDRRRIFLALAGAVESQLRAAYAKRHEEGLETQASIAGKLDVDRSVIHRRLNGAENMTLKTVADMVWALDHCIAVEIFDPAERPDRNDVVRVAPQPNTMTFSLGQWATGTQVPTIQVSSVQLIEPALQ